MIESEEKIKAVIRELFPSSVARRLICHYEKNRNDDFTLDTSKVLEVVLPEIKPPNNQVFKQEVDVAFWGKYKFLNIFFKYQDKQMSYFPETGKWRSVSTNPDCIRDESHITP